MSKIKETYVDYLGYKTYCKIVTPDNPDPAKKPLLVLHGGPGDCHNYLLTYAELADRANRQVVFYDQIGCGKSAIPHQGDRLLHLRLVGRRILHSTRGAWP